MAAKKLTDDPVSVELFKAMLKKIDCEVRPAWMPSKD